MAIGVKYFELSAKEREFILEGIEHLKDLIQNDMKLLFSGAAFKETYLAQLLPAGYYHRYDLIFVKQFYDLVLAVAYKFNDSEHLWALNSVAEELAMNAILEEARVVAGNYKEKVDFSNFANAAFKDLDFKLLLDPQMDGIEDDKDFNNEMHTVNLRFKDWFRPFRSNFKIRIGLKRS